MKDLKGHSASVTGVVFLPDNSKVASIGHDRMVRLWNVADGKELGAMGPTPDDLYGLALSPDGKKLATSGYAGNITVWDTDTKKQLYTRKAPQFGAYCIVWSPDGQKLLTGHDRQVIIVTPAKAP